MKRCTRCGSPDVVSYWHNQETRPGVSLYRLHYPDAARCIDCDHVMPNGAYDDTLEVRRVSSG